MTVMRDLFAQVVVFLGGWMLAGGGYGESYIRAAIIGGGITIALLAAVINLLCMAHLSHLITAWRAFVVASFSLLAALWFHAVYILIPPGQGVVVQEWDGTVLVNENPHRFRIQKIAGRYPWPWSVQSYCHYTLGTAHVTFGKVRLQVSVDRDGFQRLLEHGMHIERRRGLELYAEEILREVAKEGGGTPEAVEALHQRGLQAAPY